MRVVLPREVAVLRPGAVAEVGPEAVEGPGVAGEELAVGFEPGVGVPELGGEDEPAEGLDAARVDEAGLGAGRAGEDVFGVLALGRAAGVAAAGYAGGDGAGGCEAEEGESRHCGGGEVEIRWARVRCHDRRAQIQTLAAT